MTDSNIAPEEDDDKTYRVTDDGLLAKTDEADEQEFEEMDFHD